MRSRLKTLDRILGVFDLESIGAKSWMVPCPADHRWSLNEESLRRRTYNKSWFDANDLQKDYIKRRK